MGGKKRRERKIELFLFEMVVSTDPFLIADCPRFQSVTREGSHQWAGSRTMTTASLCLGQA